MRAGCGTPSGSLLGSPSVQRLVTSIPVSPGRVLVHLQHKTGPSAAHRSLPAKALMLTPITGAKTALPVALRENVKINTHKKKQSQAKVYLEINKCPPSGLYLYLFYMLFMTRCCNIQLHIHIY